MASAFHQNHGLLNPRAIVFCRLSTASQDARTRLFELLAAACHCPGRLTEIESPGLSGLAVKMGKVPSA